MTVSGTMPERTKTMRRRNGLSPAAVRRMVADWMTVDNTASQFAERANQMKVLLRDEILPKQGEEDDQGHIWIEFEEPIDDPGEKGAVTAIKRERRVSRRLNAERAEKYLKRRKLWEQCTVTVVEIDEDAVLAAAFEKKISEDDLAMLYDVTETSAFVLRRK